MSGLDNAIRRGLEDVRKGMKEAKTWAARRRWEQWRDCHLLRKVLL